MSSSTADIEPKGVLIGLVDDDSPILGALRRTLQFELGVLGFATEFVEAANPLEFLDRIADIRRRVQVVLTDTRMPHATGFDLIELMAHRIAARELPPNLQRFTDHSFYQGRESFSAVYDRVTRDTVQDMRMILLSGEYNDSQKTWVSREHMERHSNLLASLASLDTNLPRGFLHAVLGKPFDPGLLQRTVAEILR